MKIGGIHHVTGITDDLEAAHDFYAAALGLRLVKQTANQDDGRTAHLFWARYDGERVEPASALTLFGWPGSRRLARPGVGQASHVVFRAPDSEGVGLWRECLRELGIPVRTVGEPPLALRFRAPDGLELGLAVDDTGPQADKALHQPGAASRVGNLGGLGEPGG
jgi:glyoxalase family protein